MKKLYKKLSVSPIVNILLFLISAAGIAVFSLLLAIGNGQMNMFYDYFRYPLTFFLNALPVFLLQGLFWCIFGRLWIAFLLTAAVVLTASAGNFFKLIIRYEPFLFSDISFIGAALGVSKDYSLPLNSRFILMIVSVFLGTVLLAVLARRKSKSIYRIIAAALILFSCFPVKIKQCLFPEKEKALLFFVSGFCSDDLAALAHLGSSDRFPKFKDRNRGYREQDRNGKFLRLECARLDTEHGAETGNIDRCKRHRDRDDRCADEPPVRIFQHVL